MPDTEAPAFVSVASCMWSQFALPGKRYGVGEDLFAVAGKFLQRAILGLVPARTAITLLYRLVKRRIRSAPPTSFVLRYPAPAPHGSPT
jgi:hypothetical protein